MQLELWIVCRISKEFYTDTSQYLIYLKNTRQNFHNTALKYISKFKKSMREISQHSSFIRIITLRSSYVSNFEPL